jgi:hypothetical protein
MVNQSERSLALARPTEHDRFCSRLPTISAHFRMAADRSRHGRCWPCPAKTTSAIRQQELSELAPEIGSGLLKEIDR